MSKIAKQVEITKKLIERINKEFCYSFEFVMDNLEIESEEEIKELLGKEYKESKKIFDYFNREFLSRDLFVLLIKRSGNEEKYKRYLEFHEDMKKRSKRE